MTDHPSAGRLGLTPMAPRDSTEAHRAASPLELFFDLVFVVAVAFSSVELHHLQTDAHLASGTGSYLLVFFAIWWAWMNFTWFASAFDTDDWLYRLLTFTQMAGVLILAAGVRDAMEHQDFALVTAGYAVMRLALVVQWLRAAAGAGPLRTTARRFAGGIFVVQCLWIARLAAPESLGLVTFLVLVVAELAVPVWAESHRTTPWHPEHVAERYGLFTLILLGESILASANALVDAVEEGGHLVPLLVLAASAMAIAAAMWWLYFARERDAHLTSLRSSLVFGYGHYVVFAAAGAFSAGIEVVIDHVTDHTALGRTAAFATFTVPIAAFVVGTWYFALRHHLTTSRNVALVAIAVCIGLSAALPLAYVLVAVLMVAAVILVEGRAARPGTPVDAS